MILVVLQYSQGRSNRRITFSQGKKISFYRKQVINKGAMVIFGLARLVILAQQIEKLYQELENYRPPTHAIEVLQGARLSLNGF